MSNSTQIAKIEACPEHRFILEVILDISGLKLDLSGRRSWASCSIAFYAPLYGHSVYSGYRLVDGRVLATKVSAHSGETKAYVFQTRAAFDAYMDEIKK